ncbi:MAG: 4Fe-4S dicluster domain-containing protein, partial [Chthonomonas sp.]|nr:4Fe-4S dicluster domain-containing protein [Chthonomonas sp.]
DGRFANNGWLQELPKVMTTLSWDNAALISPNRASELGIKDGDHVKVTVGGQSVTIPALLLVGQSDEVVTLHMGYGRKMVGSVGNGAGTNVNALRTSEHSYNAAGTVEKDSGKTELALTQTHHSMEGRDILKAATVAEFKNNPNLKVEGDEIAEKNLSMWPTNDEEFPWDGAKWGMTIDLTLCTGCHACVAACQSENNIPVVGKEQVIKGREMHWIRIDRYYRVHGRSEEEEKRGVMSKNSEITNSRDITDPSEGKQDVLNPNAIETVFSPVACMHCEKAPCEPVCPVAATVHSHEGLNQMVYNRCVGTRYCSNNCPYKVRRFNFLNYTDNMLQFMEQNRAIPHSVISTEKPGGRGLLKLMNNPNVTVRGRGVMEKCTYCVQRINHARIEAKKENRAIRDGEVTTACQQACPTQAITFGNIADANSAVAKLKKEPRSYLMLPELNTQNRTSYLARLRNPNKELEAV